MVGIVAVTRFCESGSTAFSSYVDYIDRNEAVRKDNTEKFNLFEDYTDYMDDEAKTIRDEAKGLESVSAIFTKDEDILSLDGKKALKEVFKTAQTNGSNMWQTVISFDNAYLEEIGIYDSQTDLLNEKHLRSAARAAINNMLLKEGLENATWAASFHRNTDNIHIHIATVEPLPMREKKEYILYERDENGKLPRDEKGNIIKRAVKDKNGDVVKYEGYKGTFKAKSIEALKSTLRSELEDNKETYSEITKLVRETIIADKKDKPLLDNPLFTDKMQELYQNLRQSGIPRKNWNYNQKLIKSEKPLINDLSDFFIKTYHKDDYADFVAQIEREALRQTKAYGANTNDYVYNQLYGKEGLYARLGNAILRELKNYDKAQTDKRGIVRELEKYFDKGELIYNPEKGLELLNKQADQGNTYAQNKLGLMYLKGEDVARDTTLAKGYFKRSSENGDAFGKKMLQSMKTNKISSLLGSLGKGHIPNQAIYSSYPRADLTRAMRMLEAELSRGYEESIRNFQEAEKLQEEIENRGEEI